MIVGRPVVHSGHLMHLSEVLASLDCRPDGARKVPAVPTGSLGLDLALGGGFPGGKITELYGAPGTGKTTIALYAAYHAQATGTVLWLDTGHFDHGIAKHAGIDLRNLVLCPISGAGSALHLMEISSAECDCMIVDTASALDADEDHNDYDAMLLALRRRITHDGTTVLFINNHYVSEGMNGPFAVALRKLASVRVKLWHEGHITRALVTKNNTMPPVPFKIRFRISHGNIDWPHELILLGLETRVLHMRGTWIYFGDVALGQGVRGAATAVRAADRLVSEIRKSVICMITGENH